MNSTVTGLGTVLTLAVPQAGPRYIKFKVQRPKPSEDSVRSAAVVTINQNGTPKYVSDAGAEGGQVNLVCAVNDILTVVLTSGLASDALPNVIKTTISTGLAP